MKADLTRRMPRSLAALGWARPKQTPSPCFNQTRNSASDKSVIDLRRRRRVPNRGTKKGVFRCAVAFHEVLGFTRSDLGERLGAHIKRDLYKPFIGEEWNPISHARPRHRIFYMPAETR